MIILMEESARDELANFHEFSNGIFLQPHYLLSRCSSCGNNVSKFLEVHPEKTAGT